jgi:acyl carrier protein
MNTAVSLEEILGIVALQLGIKKIQADDIITGDLGAESADILNIITALEDKYQIVVNEEDIAGLTTARKLYQLVRDIEKSK